MRNSGWNHKLWNKKLNELPIETDSNSAWSEMQSILDKDLPLSELPKGGGLAKTIGSKIVSMLGYILPVAAMIVGLIYFFTKQPKAEKVTITKQINKNSILKTTDTIKEVSRIKNDSTTHQTIPYSSHLDKDIDDEGQVLTRASSTNPNSIKITNTLPALSTQQLAISIDNGGLIQILRKQLFNT